MTAIWILWTVLAAAFAAVTLFARAELNELHRETKWLRARLSEVHPEVWPRGEAKP